MSGEIHEISLTLGALREAVNDVRADIAEVKAMQVQHMAEFRQNQQSFAGIADDVRELKPLVADHERTRQRVYGIAAGASAVIGAASGFLTKYIG